jgi:signal transduction histidine kinase
VRAITAGDLRQQVPETAPDELGELARGFNQMAARLERLERARRELLAALAHDLHALAGAMQVAADALSVTWPGSDTPAAAGVQQVLSGLRSHTRRLGVLADDLLQVGRIETGHLVLERQSIRLGSVLQRVTDEYAAEASRLDVLLRLAGDAAEEYVLVDPERIVQALSNLLENALRVSAPHGRVVVAAERASAHDRVLLAVSDSGPGLPADAIPVLFQWADQAATSESAPVRRGRMGLGLYLAWGIVRAHGGEIRAYNLPAGGARFEVELPLAQPAETALARQEEAVR